MGGHASSDDSQQDPEKATSKAADSVVDAQELPGIDVPRRPSWFSQMFFFFVDPIIWYGFRHTMGPAEMFKPPAVETRPLYARFDAAWQRQLATGKPSIVRAVASGCWQGLLVTGVLYAISTGCQLVGPLMLQRIVSGLGCYAAGGGAACPSQGFLYYYVIAICGAPFIQSLAENQMTFLLNLIGTRMRNSLMAAIYRKCLRLSNSALQSESTGRVVTLMSNDAQKVQDVMMAIHAAWGAPVLIVVVLILLYQQVGWATFVGLGVMVIYTPLTALVSRKLLGYRRATLQWTDKRVGLMNEVISGMQMIKFYAWEDSFRKEVESARLKETDILKKCVWWQSIFVMLLFSGPIMVAVFCFGSYALAGRALSPANAYTALALFNLLRLPLAFLPMLVTMLINALVALRRISGFLEKAESSAVREREEAEARRARGEGPCSGSARQGVSGLLQRVSSGFRRARSGSKELPRRSGSKELPRQQSLQANGHAVAPNGVNGVNGVHAAPAPLPPLLPGEVRISEGGEFSWDDAQAAPSLRNCDFSAKPGTLTMVVGTVGCGKSSLLAAVIGHMERKQGRVEVGGSMAYVAQTAWIINDTVQENVVMGLPFDAERYYQAVEVAQLAPDLDILPNGDRTEIGDRGVTLSGGQKQRVSIARAVYSNADIYLLDDPLSAVDSHVGRALFEQCLRGALRDKTIVLVTNALQYLASADHVLWMEAGAVRAQGTYPQLVAQGMNIAELVQMEDVEDGGGKEEVVQPQQAVGGALAQRQGSAKVAVAVEKVAIPVEKVAVAVDGTAGGALLQQPGHGAHPHSGKSVTFGSGAAEAVGEVPPIAAVGGKGGRSASISTVHLQASMNRNLTGVEVRESGNVGKNVYGAYVAAAGGFIIVAAMVVWYGLEQGARVFSDTWVGFWFSDRFQAGVWFYLGIYAGGGILYSLFTFGRTLTFYYSTVNASRRLHNRLLRHMLRMPKTFFDTNPAGRILNRFSRDTEIMDSTLGMNMIQFITCVTTFVAILIVISVVTKWFAIAILPIFVIYIALQRYYIPTARELQRIESILRSPIYSKFSEALAGVATIRAYRREAHFTAASDELMEENAYAYVSQKAAAAWLAMRLDVIGLVILLLSAVLCIQGTIAPGLAGLCLVYALDMTRYLKQGVAMASSTESNFNSVERVVQYLQPPTEGDPDTPPDVAKTLPKDWPAHGTITVSKLAMRYRPGLPLVLRGVSFEIEGGSNVGLVGRTGSGKSSLFLALFRMVDFDSGTVLIDGVDIMRLGLRQLRSSMSIIPQDPFMFSGTVRLNLDPFGGHTDDELWRVLDAVGLRSLIADMDAKLEARVVDNGANFSLGQKQLFCMGRAMLRRSRVLMLDEATASVDPETDALIQAAIRSAFRDCTLLTIAHRLNTIMDSDKVLVMEAGLLAEAGTPHELLQRDGGAFTGLVNQTGASSSRYLRGVAEHASQTSGGGSSGGPTPTPSQAAAIRAVDPSGPPGGARIRSEVVGKAYDTNYMGPRPRPGDAKLADAEPVDPPGARDARVSAFAAGAGLTSVQGAQGAGGGAGGGPLLQQDPLGGFGASPGNLQAELSQLAHNVERGDLQVPLVVRRSLSVELPSPTGSAHGGALSGRGSGGAPSGRGSGGVAIGSSGNRSSGELPSRGSGSAAGAGAGPAGDGLARSPGRAGSGPLGIVPERHE